MGNHQLRLLLQLLWVHALLFLILKQLNDYIGSTQWRNETQTKKPCVGRHQNSKIESAQQVVDRWFAVRALSSH